MIVRTQIERKLIDGLEPLRLDIQDDSAQHRGHAGSAAEGETHFTIEVVSALFEGKGLVVRQRMVYDLLAEEMRTRVHALTLSTLTPTEDARRNR
jgi:BolA protein